MTRPPRSSKRRLAIVDQEALTTVLKALVERAGNQTKAASRFGIRQESISKHLSGKHKSLEFETYVKIMAALGGEAREFGWASQPVREFAAEPEGMEVERHRWRTRSDLEEARQELQEEKADQALREGGLIYAFERSVVTDDENFVWSQYESWTQRELGRIEERALPIVETLWGIEQCRPLLQTFLADVGRDPQGLPPEGDERCRLALCRAVDPLHGGEATWGAEPRWEEMNEVGDLVPYLTAALEREKILLRPPRDLDRVRRAKPPVSYGDWLGELAIQQGDPELSDSQKRELLDLLAAEEEGDAE